MAIDFRCQRCGKALRAADDAVGKHARCPGCDSIVPIPAETASGTRYVEPGHAMGGSLANVSPPVASDNPFAAPRAEPDALHAEGPTQKQRTGPAWEREGASVGSFFKTLTEAYGGIDRFYSTMRRKAGIGPPLAYSGIWYVVAVSVNFAMLYAMQGFYEEMAAAAGLAQNPFRLIDFGMGSLGLFLYFILILAWSIVALFIVSGLLHLGLMAIGGANQGYEATFRAFAYSNAAVAPLGIVPICGGLIGVIVFLVHMCYGISRLQDISIGKAIGGMLLGVLIYFFAACGIGAAFAFSMFVFQALN